MNTGSEKSLEIYVHILFRIQETQLQGKQRLAAASLQTSTITLSHTSSKSTCRNIQSQIFGKTLKLKGVNGKTEVMVISKASKTSFYLNYKSYSSSLMTNY